MKNFAKMYTLDLSQLTARVYSTRIQPPCQQSVKSVSSVHNENILPEKWYKRNDLQGFTMACLKIHLPYFQPNRLWPEIKEQKNKLLVEFLLI